MGFEFSNADLLLYQSIIIVDIMHQFNRKGIKEQLGWKGQLPMFLVPTIMELVHSTYNYHGNGSHLLMQNCLSNSELLAVASHTFLN